MDNRQAGRASFLVRIWREENRPIWHIWVQHIPSGKSVFPKDFQALQAFFERWTGKVNVPSQPGLK